MHPDHDEIVSLYLMSGILFELVSAFVRSFV